MFPHKQTYQHSFDGKTAVCLYLRNSHFQEVLRKRKLKHVVRCTVQTRILLIAALALLLSRTDDTGFLSRSLENGNHLTFFGDNYVRTKIFNYILKLMSSAIIYFHARINESAVIRRNSEFSVKPFDIFCVFHFF